VVQGAEPVWLVEFQVSGCVAQPEMSLQVPPSLAEVSEVDRPGWPEGLSEPGAEIETVALSPTACPDTENCRHCDHRSVVAACVTVSVAPGEVDKLKVQVPE